MYPPLDNFLGVKLKFLENSYPFQIINTPKLTNSERYPTLPILSIVFIIYF